MSEETKLVKQELSIAQKLQSVPLYQPVLTPLAYLVVSEYNPRTIDGVELQALKSSMLKDPEFLKAQPIVVNTHKGREGIVISGNQRLRAAAELDLKKVFCVFVNVPLEQEKAWNLKFNHHNGQWNEEMRKEILLDLHEDGFDMSSVGFSPETLTDYMDYTSDAGDHKNDPNYKGTTPKKKGSAKAAAAVEIECPHCNNKFTYAVKAEGQTQEA